MATETDTSDSGWSPETLKQLFSTMHNDLAVTFDKRMAERELLNAERIAHLETLLNEKVRAADAAMIAGAETIDQRINGIDKASVILADNVNRVPTLLDREMARMIALSDEKFNGVQRQFSERDVRSDADRRAAETAVNAALSAQKEAVAQQNAAYAASGAKSEAATTKQIDGIVALLGSQSTGLNDKITDLNRRMDRGDGLSSGSKNNATQTIAIIAVIASVIGVGTALFNASNRGGVSVLPPATVQAH